MADDVPSRRCCLRFCATSESTLGILRARGGVGRGDHRSRGTFSVTRAPSYLHALEGRLRIKVPEVKGCSRRARDLEQHFTPLSPIEYVSANPVTGNVLFLYDSGRTTTDE